MKIPTGEEWRGLGFAGEGIAPFSVIFFSFSLFSLIGFLFMAAVQVPSTTPESCRKDDDSSDDFEETAFFSRGCCLCWNFPCYRSQKSDWERISTSEREQQEIADGSWWRKGINAVKKVREWSEVVAGPKWKTFIRRFNKTAGRSKPGKFQYDPMSYSLNFDEGPASNSQFEDDRIFRDFSSRYAAIPVQNSQLKVMPLFT